MTPESKNLESSILQNVAAISCNRCLRTDINEDSANDIPYCAEQFYNDGWRDVDGLVYCNECIHLVKLHGHPEHF